MPVVLDSPAAVRRAAMDLLARREHGRMELSRKLRSRGAPPDLIEPALEKLADEGLLSEARYLESFVRMRANAGYGPLRIREELTQRGLPREAGIRLRTSQVSFLSVVFRCGPYLCAAVLPFSRRQPLRIYFLGRFHLCQCIDCWK